MGILRRAETKKKILPPLLQSALLQDDKDVSTEGCLEPKLASGKDVTGVIMANCGDKQWLGNQEAFTGDFHVVHEKPVAYGIQGNIIGRQDHNGGQGIGYCTEIAPTLTKTDIHAVCSLHDEIDTTIYSFDSLASNSMKSSNPHSGCREVDLAKTIDTTVPCPSKNQGGIGIVQNYKIRRLTPVECERLMGFPDTWTLIPTNKTRKLADDEYQYILKHRPGISFEEASKLSSDIPRYKALGNSMAVPCMYWIGKRIDDSLKSM